MWWIVNWEELKNTGIVDAYAGKGCTEVRAVILEEAIQTGDRDVLWLVTKRYMLKKGFSLDEIEEERLILEANYEQGNGTISQSPDEQVSDKCLSR